MSTPERSLDVTAWLRAEAEGFADMHGVPPANVAWHKESADRFCEATDTIDALQQDVRRLEAERNKWESVAQSVMHDVGMVNAELSRAEADRDAQVREAFMAGYAEARPKGGMGFGGEWQQDASEAFDVFIAQRQPSAAGARTDASPHTCMGGDPGSGLNGPCRACEIEREHAALLSIANNSCCTPCREARLVARKALSLDTE